MRATTIRFSDELWGALETESSASGVSVAQFVREASLARVAYAAGTRGDRRYDGALGWARADGREDGSAVGAR